MLVEGEGTEVVDGEVQWWFSGSEQSLRGCLSARWAGRRVAIARRKCLAPIIANLRLLEIGGYEGNTSQVSGIKIIRLTRQECSRVEVDRLITERFM